MAATRPQDSQKWRDQEADDALQRDKDTLDDDEFTAEFAAEFADEMKFLKEFPRWKQAEEDKIKTLHAIANDLEATHKTVNKIGVVANSVGVVSGAMTILGFVLAPVTAGGSLVLSAASQGLGAVAGVTNIATSMQEHFKNKRAHALASSLLPTSDLEAPEFSYLARAGEIASKCGNAALAMKKEIRAFQRVKNTTLVLSGKALMGRAMVIVNLCCDAHSLWKNRKELKGEGDGAELAKELRTLASRLERRLMNFSQRHQRLQQVRPE
ncbi:apolipoprotein L6-like [Ochotona princeps]|uniref:apolipoprotein L6-like n=1 Tax=Ochotona princeps TaxID=9978 RepID=UPI00271518BF|nr:apolipoprotein L6-like [Ochotona princeps]